jgi:hypothetical protein
VEEVFTAAEADLQPYAGYRAREKRRQIRRSRCREVKPIARQLPFERGRLARAEPLAVPAAVKSFGRPLAAFFRRHVVS